MLCYERKSSINNIDCSFFFFFPFSFFFSSLKPHRIESIFFSRVSFCAWGPNQAIHCLSLVECATRTAFVHLFPLFLTIHPTSVRLFVKLSVTTKLFQYSQNLLCTCMYIFFLLIYPSVFIVTARHCGDAFPLVGNNGWTLLLFYLCSYCCCCCCCCHCCQKRWTRTRRVTY